MKNELFLQESFNINLIDIVYSRSYGLLVGVAAYEGHTLAFPIWGDDKYRTNGITQIRLARTTNINHIVEGNSLSIYPNPAKKKTTLSFVLPKSSMVNISIFDIRGKQLSTPVNKTLIAGEHKIDIPLRAFPEGIYHARIIINGMIHNMSFAVMKQ